MTTSFRQPKMQWLIPTGLLILSLVPVIAGAARMAELGSGAAITPDNARFFASPIPIVLHIVSITLYAILGAFQFAPTFRRRHVKWHRAIGRILVPAGLVAALSGLWMSHFYPWPQYDGVMLYGLRLLFGFAMLVSIILGAVAIQQRDYKQHGAWMIRAYAIGMGAGTQVFTHIPWFLFPSLQGELLRVLCMGAGWVLNLAVAEWAIRKRPFATTNTHFRKTAVSSQ